MIRAVVQLEKMIYLRANCYRRLCRFELAARDYRSIMLLLKQNQYQSLIKYVIGVLLLPL